MRTNLKVFRVKQGLTQQQMADRLGYTRASYQAIEKGKRNGQKAFWDTLQGKFAIPSADMWELQKNDT